MSGAIPPLQYAFMAWCSVKRKSTGTSVITLKIAHGLSELISFHCYIYVHMQTVIIGSECCCISKAEWTQRHLICRTCPGSSGGCVFNPRWKGKFFGDRKQVNQEQARKAMPTACGNSHNSSGNPTDILTMPVCTSAQSVWWLGYGLDSRGSFPSGRQWWNVFLFPTASRMVLRPNHPLIQWVPAVKRLGCEADHSPP
jgi:hypothetical protein